MNDGLRTSIEVVLLDHFGRPGTALAEGEFTADNLRVAVAAYAEHDGNMGELAHHYAEWLDSDPFLVAS